MIFAISGVSWLPKHYARESFCQASATPPTTRKVGHRLAGVIFAVSGVSWLPKHYARESFCQASATPLPTRKVGHRLAGVIFAISGIVVFLVIFA